LNLSFFVASFALLQTSAPAVLEVDERVPAVMMVMTPRGPASKARTTEILSEAATILKQNTGLSLASVEQAGIDSQDLDRCPKQTQLGCWSAIVISAYESAADIANENTLASQRPAYLMVISVLADPKRGDRFSTLLIDLGQVREIEGQLSSRTTDRAQTKENLIFERAVQSKRGFARLADGAALRSYLKTLMTAELRGVFERNGHWAPFGRVHLRAAAGLIVQLDGRQLGTLKQDETEITGLLPGKRKIEVLHPESLMIPFRSEIGVRPGQKSILNVEMIAAGTPAVAAAKEIMIWSGLGFLAAGVGLVTFAGVVEPNSRFSHPCVGTDCDTALAPEFTRFCDHGAPDGSCGGISSVSIAPLGYSLMGTGAIWSASAYWGDEKGYFRWWGSLAGLAVGAASYGLSVGLEGE